MISSAALTSAAMQAKKARGEFLGGHVPYGKRRVTPGSIWLRLEPAEQAVIAEVKRMSAARMSLRDIASALYERGVRSHQGGRFHPMTISRMLKL